MQNFRDIEATHSELSRDRKEGSAHMHLMSIKKSPNNKFTALSFGLFFATLGAEAAILLLPRAIVLYATRSVIPITQSTQCVAAEALKGG